MSGLDLRDLPAEAVEKLKPLRGHEGPATPVGRRGQVMSRLAPILADDKDAAALLSMKPADFRALVEAGHLPKGKEIAPGFTRWDVDQLRRLARGDAAEGLGAVEW
jgi:hypothetical protein